MTIIKVRIRRPSAGSARWSYQRQEFDGNSRTLKRSRGISASVARDAAETGRPAFIERAAKRSSEYSDDRVHQVVAMHNARYRPKQEHLFDDIPY